MPRPGIWRWSICWPLLYLLAVAGWDAGNLHIEFIAPRFDHHLERLLGLFPGVSVEIALACLLGLEFRPVRDRARRLFRGNAIGHQEQRHDEFVHHGKPPINAD